MHIGARLLLYFCIYWQAKRAHLVIQLAWASIYIYIYIYVSCILAPGLCCDIGLHNIGKSDFHILSMSYSSFLKKHNSISIFACRNLSLRTGE